MKSKIRAAGILLFILLLSAGAASTLDRLRFDYHFESFFPAGDPELTFFNEFKKKFGNDNDYILVGIASENGIFREDFLSEISRLTDSLKTIPDITGVTSPVNVSFMVAGPFGPVEVPYLHPSDPSKYSQDSARIYSTPGVSGTLFSKDGKAVNILLTTIQEPTKVKSDSIVLNLRRILSGFTFSEVHVAGKVPAQYTYINRMQNELKVFISLGVVLLVITLLLMFRSFWAIVVPLVIVFLSILFLLAVMALSGKDIDLIMTLMPTMMFVVSMSDSIHLLSRYTELMREGYDRHSALQLSVKEIGLATLLTSVTTAMGFMTLVTSTIVPVQEFGLYIGIGVGLAFILTIVVIPAVFTLVPPPGQKRVNITFSAKWLKLLRRLFSLTLRNKWKIAAITVLILGLSGLGITRMQVNSFLLEDLRADDPLRKDFLFLEERFGGVRPMEIMVSVKDSSSVWDYENILAFERLSLFTARLYDSGFLMSPAAVVKGINQALHGGRTEYFRIPADEKEYRQIKREILRYRKSGLLTRFATPDQRHGRISGRMGDRGSRKIRMKDEAFYEVVPSMADTNVLSVRITGTARLIDKNISYMSVNMVEGLLAAFILIAVIAGFMFWSWRIILFALVPNIIPLLMIGGLMGFMGIDLKVSTSIIFTIAFGIAVDDTIHFLSRFRMELAAGRTVPWALRRSYNITGKAIILTSLVLVSGFFTLIFSDFEGTYLVGLLISLTLLFAVVSDLFLLPLLLLFYRGKNR